jgi:hypothetical protein
MWYTLRYAKTYLYPAVDRGRTAHPAGGTALVQCLCVAPLPDPPGQCSGPDCPRDCRNPGLRRSDGPQCHFCLQYSRRGRPDARLLCPEADPHAAFDVPRREQLRAFLHQSPRTFGHPTSPWTLTRVATTASAEGLTHRPIRGEAIRRALARLGVRWPRAKHWITSLDPAYLRTKNGATG